MSVNIHSNFDLKHKNTLAIQAIAERYCEVQDSDELHEVVAYAQENGLPVRILGGGSNVVMADHINALVVSCTNTQCEIVEEDGETVLLEVGAGYEWHRFVLDTLDKGWFGLENLALIPGTVGAAPVQNIGAYGVEVKDFIESVCGVYLENGEPFTFSNDECAFAYRESCFKQSLDGKTLITSVRFRLSKHANVNVAYAPLNGMAAEQGIPTPKQLAQWVIEVRSSKLPDPNELPNAGSFFKNPVISKKEFKRLQTQYDDLPSYDQGDDVKVPAGWLIDRMGYKGKTFEGNVSVHKKQALVLINQGGSGAQVLAAAKCIKQAVQSIYGISLEQEPRLFS